MNLMPYDELNVLEESFTNKTYKQIKDDLLDFLIDCYVLGVFSANNTLGTEFEVNLDELEKTLYFQVEDKNFVDRLKEYPNNPEKLKRLAETESHRVYNTAVYNTALQSNKSVKKTWVTMDDEKVRDTHSYIDGITVNLNDKFFTYDGDSALYPGNFKKAENNVNCRCVIELS